MSAFLVADKTINKILNVLEQHIGRSTRLKTKFEDELGITFGENWQTKLGQKMWDLNQLALGYRYGDEKQELVYKFSAAACTTIQAYKALRCWIYQCCEGEIPEQSKLYKFFDEIVSQHLAHWIITSVPEYDRAEWG